MIFSGSNGDGTFTDVTAKAGNVGGAELGPGGVAADYKTTMASRIYTSTISAPTCFTATMEMELYRCHRACRRGSAASDLDAAALRPSAISIKDGHLDLWRRRPH